MEGRKILVTGSSSGIGRAVAHLFSKNGHQVAIHGSNIEKVNKVVEECNNLSPNKTEAFGVVVDFKNPKDSYTVINKTIEKFGSLDVLVNCAGIYTAPKSNKFHDIYENYELVRSIELDSPVNVSLAAIEHLKKSEKKPTIIFLTCIDKPFVELAANCTAKMGLAMFAKCLALEHAPNIRVNLIEPAHTNTPAMLEAYKEHKGALEAAINKYPMKRMAQPEEMAQSIYYLASQSADWITGVSLVIDGGYMLT